MAVVFSSAGIQTADEYFSNEPLHDADDFVLSWCDYPLASVPWVFVRVDVPELADNLLSCVYGHHNEHVWCTRADRGRWRRGDYVRTTVVPTEVIQHVHRGTSIVFWNKDDPARRVLVALQCDPDAPSHTQYRNSSFYTVQYEAVHADRWKATVQDDHVGYWDVHHLAANIGEWLALPVEHFPHAVWRPI